jgi:AcrR family transcriptional regulator
MEPEQTIRPARRRPGEPQREQKEATRRQLLDAARAVFDCYSYSMSSVEMIAEEAGFSRTTFYRHFDGKLPIALALFENLRPELHSRWGNILAQGRPSLETTRAWLVKYVETVEANKSLIRVLHQIEAIEAEVQPNMLQYHEQVLEYMWPASERAYIKDLDETLARSLLLLLQMDQFLYLFTVRDWAIDREAVIEAMSRSLHSFIERRNAELESAKESTRLAS